MELSARVLAEFLAMTKTREGKRTVKAKAPAKKCLRCDSPAAIGMRGLCDKHYNQFCWDRKCAGAAMKTEEKARKARERYDEQEVEAGRILGARRGKRRKAS